MSISLLFFKRNIKSFSNIILSLSFFILIFNFIIGFILNITNNYKTDIVDNSNLYFMQVESNDQNYSFNSDVLNKISDIPGVEYAFFDYDMTTEILSDNKQSKSSSAIIPVSKEYLSYFGIKNPINSERYFLLNDVAVNSENFYNDENVTLRAYIPTIKNGNIYGDSTSLSTSITSKFTMPELLYFPPDTSIIDPITFEELFDTNNNNINSSKIIVICPKVDIMKDISKKVEEIDNNFIVKYALKATNTLPQFAVIITTISSFILIFFLIITIFSVSSNIKQFLISRKRDIGLLYILGVEKKNIYKLFINEFFFNGIVILSLSFTATIIVSLTLNYFFKFDLISKYIYLYLTLDFLIAIGLLVILGAIQLKKLIKKLNSGTFYKEVLK